MARCGIRENPCLEPLDWRAPSVIYWLQYQVASLVPFTARPCIPFLDPTLSETLKVDAGARRAAKIYSPSPPPPPPLSLSHSPSGLYNMLTARGWTMPFSFDVSEKNTELSFCDPGTRNLGRAEAANGLAADSRTTAGVPSS